MGERSARVPLFDVTATGATAVQYNTIVHFDALLPLLSWTLLFALINYLRFY